MKYTITVALLLVLLISGCKKDHQYADGSWFESISDYNSSIENPSTDGNFLENKLNMFG